MVERECSAIRCFSASVLQYCQIGHCVVVPVKTFVMGETITESTPLDRGVISDGDVIVARRTPALSFDALLALLVIRAGTIFQVSTDHTGIDGWVWNAGSHILHRSPQDRRDLDPVQILRVDISALGCFIVIHLRGEALSSSFILQLAGVQRTVQDAKLQTLSTISDTVGYVDCQTRFAFHAVVFRLRTRAIG